MGRPRPTVTKPQKVVYWRSASGKWVVVQGPFPDPFYRSETRSTPEKAAKLIIDDIYNRPGTTQTDAYAKVLASSVEELDGGENEFGPITP